MAEVAFEQATRIYPGNDEPAVDKLDLTVEDGEFLVLVGPSGSGKSTALRMLAGLEPIDDGRIWIGGKDVTLVAPRDRDIAMVFQNYALYPNMTVAQNMGFALKQAGVPKEDRREKVTRAAEILGVSEFLNRKPKNLSGGQRQRVAMGRAIVREPQVFLMDEPLSNLDAKLRVQTRMEVADLQARLGVTTVYVTHDQVEAMTLGHRVAVLNYGVLQQDDKPKSLYDRPANLFVAGFIGSPAMNLLEAEITAQGLDLGGVKLDVDPEVATQLSEGDKVTIGVRPEHTHLTSPGSEGAIDGTVLVIEELGSEAYLNVAIEHQGRDERLLVRTEGGTLASRDDRVGIIPGDVIHVFDAAGARVTAD